MIVFMTNLCTPHIEFCKVHKSSSEFQTQIQPQRPVRFSMPSKEGNLLVDDDDDDNKKTDIEYPFEHG